jgi:hypothetical protein
VYRLRVFENRVLRKIFGPKREEVSREKFHNQEVRNLCSSGIILVVKSKGMRCVGHVALMVVTRRHAEFWWVKLKEGDHMEDLDLDGRIMLKCILKKEGGRARTGFIWLL